MGRERVDKDDGADEGDDEEGKGQGEDDDSLFPRGDAAMLLVWGGLLGGSREEDEEEEHAGRGGLAVASVGRVVQEADAHEEEAGPLHANLRDSQHGGCAWELGNLAAASHVARAFRQRQDVCNAGGAGHGAQEDKQRAQATRRAPRYDLVVLWEVRDEDAQHDEAVVLGG